MKALILSTKTGQGHNSASMAIASCLENEGWEAIVSDVLKSGKRNVSAPVSALYDNIVLHMPALFGMLYRAGELVSSSKRHSPIYYLNSIYSGKLLDKIKSTEPQIIICPHIFSAQAITRLYEKHELSTPSVGILTDYTCSPFWEETRLDAYVIPAPQLIDEFAYKGIPREKLYPLGIPVNSCFKKTHDKAEARRLFGITADKVFTVMGGSMGYGYIRELSTLLAGKMPRAQVIAVCGNNEKLFKSFTGISNIIPFQFIDNIDILMDATDVLLTKPGGLSSTEALSKRLPVVLTCPIPGGEERNADFLSSIGVAEYAKTPESAVEKAIELVFDMRKRKKMIEAQEKYINRDADRDIAKLIIKLSEKAGGRQMCKAV